MKLNRIKAAVAAVIMTASFMTAGDLKTEKVSAISASIRTRIEVTLDDPDFKIKGDDTITLNDLNNHGFKLYDIYGSFHDINWDPLYQSGQIMESAEPVLNTDDSVKLNVICPDRFVNGENYIAVEAVFKDKKFQTPVKINVELDGTQTPEETVNIPCGDINNDDVTDMTDMTQISLCILGENEAVVDDKGRIIGDTDENGKLELADLALFKQYLSFEKEISYVVDYGWDSEYYWDFRSNGVLDVYKNEKRKGTEFKSWDAYRNRITRVVLNEGIEKISDMSDIPFVRSVYIPETMKEIGSRFFSDCSLLEKVTVNGDIEKVAEDAFKNTPYIMNPENGCVILGNVLFKYCGTDENVVVPEGVTEISPLAFYQSSVKSVKLPETLKKIGNNAFTSCIKLEKINLPESLEDIGIGVFAYTDSLKSVKLPENMKKVPEHMFSYAGIENITVPKSVENIEYCAFHACKNLKKITIENENCIYNESMLDCDYTVTVECGGKETVYNPLILYRDGELDIDITAGNKIKEKNQLQPL